MFEGLFGKRKRENEWDKRKRTYINQLDGCIKKALATIDEALEELEREYYATGFEVEAYETILQEKEKELELNPNPRLEDEVNRILLEAERINERYTYLGNLIDDLRDVKMAIIVAGDKTRTQVIMNKGDLVEKLKAIKYMLPRILAGEDLKDLKILAEIIKKECQVEERRHAIKRSVKTKLGERIDRVRELLRNVQSEKNEDEEVHNS